MRPYDICFRNEEPSLIKFPDDHPKLEVTSKQDSDTQRILDEINRINSELGYGKKNKVLGPKMTNEGYFFFPQQPHQSPMERYGEQRIRFPSYRQSNEGMVARKIVHQHSVILPNPQYQMLPFLYPTNLQLPLLDPSRVFANDMPPIAQNPGSGLAGDSVVIDNDITSMVEYAPGFLEDLNSVRQSKEKSRLRTKNRVKTGQSSKRTGVTSTNKTALIESRRNDGDNINIIVVTPKASTRIPIESSRSQAPPAQVTTPPVRSTQTVPAKQQATYIRLNATTLARLNQTLNDQTKTLFFQGSTRPKQKPVVFRRPVEAVAAPGQLGDQAIATPQQVFVQAAPQADPMPTVKGPFASFFGLNGQRDTEELKAIESGGILIQRLRVRNGGIAIAGPNGVATAGSGGTAIVGPNGIAITHPKSLTIAAPGARVLSVPRTVDLKELALRTNPDRLPKEGKLVATGPVVYFNDSE